MTYCPDPGIHDWPYWRRDLTNAIGWGLYATVSEHSSDWTYQTVAQDSDTWGYHFRFQNSPPETVETFTLDGHTLSGTGSGQVAVRTPNGQRFTATLPFQRDLPR